MKKIITLILSVVCMNVMLHAQSQSEARSSRNYFGEATAARPEIALEQAKNNFVAKIRVDMLKDVQFRKADPFTCRKIAEQAKVYQAKKGKQDLAIVYIPKNELKRLYAEVVMFDELPDDGLDEFGNIRDQLATTTTPATSEPIRVIAEDTPPIKQPEQQPVQVDRTATQPVVSQPVTSEPVVQQPVSQPTTVVQSTQGAPAKTGNQYLDEILEAHNLFELNDFFTRGKNSGALAYGRLETLTAPENSYLLVYQPDGTIVAVYDKGSNTRRNLRTGVVENYATAFNNIKIIWFQLYR